MPNANVLVPSQQLAPAARELPPASSNSGLVHVAQAPDLRVEKTSATGRVREVGSVPVEFVTAVDDDGPYWVFVGRLLIDDVYRSTSEPFGSLERRLVEDTGAASMVVVSQEEDTAQVRACFRRTYRMHGQTTTVGAGAFTYPTPDDPTSNASFRRTCLEALALSKGTSIRFDIRSAENDTRSDGTLVAHVQGGKATRPDGTALDVAALADGATP